MISKTTDKASGKEMKKVRKKVRLDVRNITKPPSANTYSKYSAMETKQNQEVGNMGSSPGFSTKQVLVQPFTPSAHTVCAR